MLNEYRDGMEDNNIAELKLADDDEKEEAGGNRRNNSSCSSFLSFREDRGGRGELLTLECSSFFLCREESRGGIAEVKILDDMKKRGRD